MSSVALSILYFKPKIWASNLRPAAKFVNFLYTIKITQYVRRLDVRFNLFLHLGQQNRPQERVWLFFIKGLGAHVRNYMQKLSFCVRAYIPYII